ncbi:CIC11C00000004768 [Sungouiella intermedia]|uniref:Probable cytosolic iron-sulfur protein assembly protein 1 n=1 Tax=Sungouiella intermedia TaxID=45354 RepID=A0A1L0BH28_9ASCO|nr:CIC11C00000004768 [[Candida] intermedia]
MVKLLKSIPAHSDKAWSVSSHQTLPLLATASSDKTSKIFKLSREQNFPLIGNLEETHKRSVRTVSFKPPLSSSESEFVDLPALACGSFDSTISVWGIDEPEELLNNEEDLGEYEDQRAAEARKKREIDILTSASNEWNLMALIEGHENEVKAVAWNKTGNYLASCSRDKTIWIWETDAETLEEFECISVLSDHEHDIKHIIWHPKMNLLASSSYDDTIRLYKQDDDDEDWSCVGILNGHDGTVWCSSFENPDCSVASKDKIRLVSVSDDLTARVWVSNASPTEDEEEKGTGIPSSIKHRSSEMEWELQSILPEVHKYAIYSVSWSPKSGRIATTGADGQIAVYKETNGVWEVESVHKSSHGVYEINCVSWCTLSNGEEVLVSAGDDGYINIWEA